MSETTSEITKPNYKPSNVLLYHVKLGIPGKLLKDPNFTHACSHFTCATRQQACENLYKLLFKTLFLSDYNNVNPDDELLNDIFNIFVQDCIDIFNNYLLELEFFCKQRYDSFVDYINKENITSFLDERLKAKKFQLLQEQKDYLIQAASRFNTKFREKVLKAVDTIYGNSHYQKVLKDEVERLCNWFISFKESGVNSPLRQNLGIPAEPIAVSPMLSIAVSFEGEEIASSSYPKNSQIPHVHAHPDFTFIDFISPLGELLENLKQAKNKDKKIELTKRETAEFLKELERLEELEKNANNPKLKHYENNPELTCNISREHKESLEEHTNELLETLEESYKDILDIP
jgi:hypothetical protein